MVEIAGTGRASPTSVRYACFIRRLAGTSSLCFAGAVPSADREIPGCAGRPGNRRSAASGCTTGSCAADPIWARRSFRSQAACSTGQPRPNAGDHRARRRSGATPEAVTNERPANPAISGKPGPMPKPSAVDIAILYDGIRLFRSSGSAFFQVVAGSCAATDKVRNDWEKNDPPPESPKNLSILSTGSTSVGAGVSGKERVGHASGGKRRGAQR